MTPKWTENSGRKVRQYFDCGVIGGRRCLLQVFPAAAASMMVMRASAGRRISEIKL
jgi:hypothetical protein